MIFRRKVKDQGPPTPPQEILPEIIVWHDHPTTRFCFEEALLRNPEAHSLEALLPLWRQLRNLQGVGQVRLYPHYISIWRLDTTNAPQIKEQVIPILQHHFEWPDTPHVQDISNDNQLRSLDRARHGNGLKWQLGVRRYL